MLINKNNNIDHSSTILCLPYCRLVTECRPVIHTVSTVWLARL